MRALVQFLLKHPTQQKIVFASFRDGNREIYLMNPDGSQQVNITNHPAEGCLSGLGRPQGSISFSYQIVMACGDLYLMDADGGNVRKIF